MKTVPLYRNTNWTYVSFEYLEYEISTVWVYLRIWSSNLVFIFNTSRLDLTMIRVRNFWVHSGSASKRTSFTKPFLLEDVSFIIQLTFKIVSTHSSNFFSFRVRSLFFIANTMTWKFLENSKISKSVLRPTFKAPVRESLTFTIQVE